MKRYLIILLLPMVVLADDDCRGNHNCTGGDGAGVTTVGVDSNVSITSPVSVESVSNFDSNVSHSSKAYAIGLGDVDINQCYRSYQALAWQDSRLNYWCVGESLDARGLHRAAALARCHIKGYRELFASHEECITENTMLPLADVPELAPVIDRDKEEFQRQWLEEQQEMIVDLQAKLENLEKEKQRPVNRTVVEQKPWLTAEQVQELRIAK